MYMAYMRTIQQSYSLHADVLNYEINKRSVSQISKQNLFAFLSKCFQTSSEYPDGPDLDRKFLRRQNPLLAGKYLITFYDDFLS